MLWVVVRKLTGRLFQSFLGANPFAEVLQLFACRSRILLSDITNESHLARFLRFVFIGAKIAC